MNNKNVLLLIAVVAVIAVLILRYFAIRKCINGAPVTFSYDW